ncbi:MAG: hypothetical protein N4A31_05455 [Rickettsiales bacterium]|jgi:hypothetical protein|nr:hypothetical protein [Rickettsiales bacterium]
MRIKLSKKIVIVILSLLLAAGVGRILKVKGYIPKDAFYQGLVKLDVAKQCYNAYKTMLEVFNQEGLDYKKENEKIIASSLVKLLDQNAEISEIPKIPSVTHKVFFISLKSPPVLNDFYIEEMKVNFSKLNSLGHDWQHNIWTNKADFIPEEIRNIKGVRIRDVEEFKDSQLYEILLEILDKGQDIKPHLAEASDLIRLMVLQKFGGIYSDMDYEIYNPKALYELMQKFDFIGGREKQTEFSYYGNAFIAAKPNHPVINEALRMSLRNRVVNLERPIYIEYPCKGYDKLYFNGPPLLTIAYFRKNNIDSNNDVILPPWMIYNLNFARFKNGISYSNEEDSNLSFFERVKRMFRINVAKDINKVCNYSRITKDHFNLNNQNLDQLIIDFTDNITIEDVQKYYEIDDNMISEDYKNNIYYNIQNRRDFDIIGADMFCGSWTFGGKVFRRKYYWNLPWSYSK